MLELYIINKNIIRIELQIARHRKVLFDFYY